MTPAEPPRRELLGLRPEQEEHRLIEGEDRVEAQLEQLLHVA